MTKRRYFLAKRNLDTGAETLLNVTSKKMTLEEAERLADEFDALELMTEPNSNIRHFPVEMEDDQQRGRQSPSPS